MMMRARYLLGGVLLVSSVQATALQDTSWRQIARPELEQDAQTLQLVELGAHLFNAVLATATAATIKSSQNADYEVATLDVFCATSWGIKQIALITQELLNQPRSVLAASLAQYVTTLGLLKQLRYAREDPVTVVRLALFCALVTALRTVILNKLRSTMPENKWRFFGCNIGLHLVQTMIVMFAETLWNWNFDGFGDLMAYVLVPTPLYCVATATEDLVQQALSIVLAERLARSVHVVE